MDWGFWIALFLYATGCQVAWRLLEEIPRYDGPKWALWAAAVVWPLMVLAAYALTAHEKAKPILRKFRSKAFWEGFWKGSAP